MSEPIPTILVVEDEFLIRDYVADHLRDSGFNVIAVGDASRAVDLLTTGTRIDLVFTDITLPGEMDGFELVRWIRSRDRTLPVVLTSGGHNAAKAADVCKNEPFVSKPYNPVSLVAYFRRVLGRTDVA